MKHCRILATGLVVAMASWVSTPLVFAQAESPDAVVYQGPIHPRAPLNWCRIYADGTRGPWIPYQPTEGLPAEGHGFDTIEPMLPSSPNPCGFVVDFLPPLVNGVMQGGIDPYCQIGADTPGCPGMPTRYIFGTFGTFATGSVAHPMNPPLYAVGQDIREIEFLFTENKAAGQMDGAIPPNVIGNTFIDVIWHAPSAMNSATACAGLAQPLLGVFIDGAGFDFGPSQGNPDTPDPADPGFWLGGALIDVLTPPFVIPPFGGSFEILYWNDAAATIVSGNNQPGGWSSKDVNIQGSSGPVRFRNNDFTPVTDDTGGQYTIAPAAPNECFVASATLCPVPVVAALRLGVAEEFNTADCNNNGIPDADELNPTVDCNGDEVLDECQVADFTTAFDEFFEVADGFTTASGPGTNGWGWSSNIAGITTTNPCQAAQNLSSGSCDFAICDNSCNDTASQSILSPNFVNITTPTNSNAVQRLTAKLRIDGTNTGQCTAPTYFITPFHNDFPGGGQPATRIGLRPNGSIVVDTEGDGVPPYAPASVAGATYPSNVCFDLAIVTDRSAAVGNRLRVFVDNVLVHVGDPTLVGPDPVTFLQNLNIESNNHANTRTIRLDAVVLGNSKTAPLDLNFNGQVDSCEGQPVVDIVAANPPTDNPYVAGQQPFRDALQTGTSTTLVTQGIGAAGTPAQDSITYAPISVTFSGTPSPAPTAANVTIACTGGICPTVTGVTGTGAGPYAVSLSGAVPPAHCTTLTFAGTTAGQKLQYQSIPGDMNQNGTTTAIDVQVLVTALANGQAAIPANLARYNVNRAATVTPSDVLREVGLVNGLQTTQVWLGVTAAACP